jgi:hypothetical protein
MIEIAIYGVAFPKPQAFENGKIACQPNRDRWKDNVKRDRKTELDARQLERR